LHLATAAAAPAPCSLSLHDALPILVGDDAVRDAGTPCVRHTGQSRYAADSGLEQLGAVGVLGTRHQRHQAFETETRVDVLLRQRDEYAAIAPVELGEHQVPELYVSVPATGVGSVLVRGAEGRPAVEEDLGARATGTVGAEADRVGGPEVLVLTEA